MNVERPITDRLAHLDVLRGFALFGVLLVNFEWFNLPTQAMMLPRPATGTNFDLASRFLIEWLAESKFFPLFSMLFGMGFAIQFTRARQSGRPFAALYLRRLLILAVFGCMHIVFVWSGDILLIYAGIALLMLLLFRKTPTRRLWKWAVTCWLLPMAWLMLWAVVFELLPADSEIYKGATAAAQQESAALMERIAVAEQIHREGSFRENARQRIADFRYVATDFSFFWVPMVLGYFLLGRWLIESGLLINPAAHVDRLRRWQWRGLLYGLPASLVALLIIRGHQGDLPDLRMGMGYLLHLTGGIALTLGYLTLVTRNAARLGVLATAGRMALTNYLVQSLFWTTLLYGYGFGLWGRIPISLHLPLALAFFALQVAVSRWWLTRFRFGPMEWLWRAGTYLKRP